LGEVIQGKIVLGPIDLFYGQNLRKFKIRLHMMVVFAAENVHNFTALYENNGGVKAIRSYENKT